MTTSNTSSALDVPLAENVDFCPSTFGKYKGQTPEWISLNDPRYLVWVYESGRKDFCSKALYVDTRNELGEDND